MRTNVSCPSDARIASIEIDPHPYCLNVALPCLVGIDHLE